MNLTYDMTFMKRVGNERVFLIATFRDLRYLNLYFHFSGCFQGFYINGKQLDFSVSKYNHKVMPGCKVDPCANNKCKYGQCKARKKKGGYRCKCKRGYTGKFCDIGEEFKF